MDAALAEVVREALRDAYETGRQQGHLEARGAAEYEPLGIDALLADYFAADGAVGWVARKRTDDDDTR